MMKYDPKDPVACPRTKQLVNKSDVASWLSASSDVFGARIRVRFPIYPTLSPNKAIRQQNTTSELNMTGNVRRSGPALQNIKRGIKARRSTCAVLYMAFPAFVLPGSCMIVAKVRPVKSETLNNNTESTGVKYFSFHLVFL